MYKRQALYESIERGQTLSQALRSEGCPPIALALLESGEAAGTLGESLQYISRHYDWERQLKQKVMSAISYPLFLLLMMNIFFLVTILFIIPSFEKVFTTMHITLPLSLIHIFLKNPEDKSLHEEASKRVAALCEAYPLY